MLRFRFPINPARACISYLSIRYLMHLIIAGFMASNRAFLPSVVSRYSTTISFLVIRAIVNKVEQSTIPNRDTPVYLFSSHKAEEYRTEFLRLKPHLSGQRDAR